MSTARVAVPITNVWRDPEAPTADDDLVTRQDADGWAWAESLDTGARGHLEHRLDTQALLGEPVEVVRTVGAWSEVRLPWQPSRRALDGYPGWVAAAHLVSAPAASRAADGAAVTSRMTIVTAPDSGRRTRISFGTVLQVIDEHDDQFAAELPGGRLVLVPRADLTLAEDRESLDLLELARRFEGLGYLWAGLSGAGTDCSGLVHLCARAAGIVVPRDADDQALTGKIVAPEAVEAGDAVYFENDRGVHHTGFALSQTELLHSPRTGKDVGTGSIVDDYPGERKAFRRVKPRAGRR